MYIQKDTIVFSGDDTITFDSRVDCDNFIFDKCVKIKLDINNQLILHSKNYVELEGGEYKSVNELEEGDALLYHKAKPNTFGYTDTADNWTIIAISLLNLDNNKFDIPDEKLNNTFNELSNKIYPSIKKEYDGEFKNILENNYNNITDIFRASLIDRIEFCSVFEDRAKIRKSIDKNVLVNIFYSIGKDVAIVDNHEDYYILIKLNLNGYDSILTKVLSIEYLEDNCYNIYQNDVIINGIRVVTSPIK